MGKIQDTKSIKKGPAKGWGLADRARKFGNSKIRPQNGGVHNTVNELARTVKPLTTPTNVAASGESTAAASVRAGPPFAPTPPA